ncbi:MAG TPA: hypothetical protein VHI54_11210 [Actinomycetota bacterium]|nr:hypothetical protein [Actinomycetota bacterium]
MPAASFLRRALPLIVVAAVAAGCTTEASPQLRVRDQVQPKPSASAPKCKAKPVKASFDYPRGFPGTDRAFVQKVTRQAISYFGIRTTNCVKRDPVDVRLLAARGSHNIVGWADYGDIEIYTESPGWAQNSQGFRAQTLFHEWYHVLQRTLSTAPPPPTWFFEGSAEWAALDAAVHFGYFDDMDEVRPLLRYDARQPPRPLDKAKPANPGVYSLYFTSIDFLLKEHGGRDRLRQFWQRYNPGDSWKATFQSVFKTKVTTFLKKFEAHREAGFTD